LLVTETKSYSLFTLIDSKKQNEFSNPASTKLSTSISFNHCIKLGNKLTVISDKRLIFCGSDTVYYYSADIISATDYSPFGAPLASRTYQASEYRFAFNGKEKDNETFGDGNMYDYGMRMYNSRLGRPFSVDPYRAKYPHLSPFQFYSNNPILNIDLDGLEGVDYTRNVVLMSNGQPRFQLENANNITRMPLYTWMINGTMFIMHQEKIISFNPSSAPNAVKLAFTPSLNLHGAMCFSKTLLAQTPRLTESISAETGVSQGVAGNGFANTLRHFAWQASLTLAYGENAAKALGDYHERDGIINVQDGKFAKDNVIDLINNEYARDYAKGFDFQQVMSSPENYADFLNGLAQHIANTVDGYKDDKSFDRIRSGEFKLFDANDESFGDLFKSVQEMGSVPPAQQH
jgi:RHS repeat-associated protein